MRKAFEASLKKTASEKSAGSDGEAIQKAAKELGYDISIEELERFFADKQEVSDNDLDAVAGGKDAWCTKNYYCYTIWNHKDEKDDTIACLKDYNCIAVYHVNVDCTNNYWPDSLI